MLGVLHLVYAIFLHQVHAPEFSVAEPDLNTGALLQEGITVRHFGQLRVVAEIGFYRKFAVRIYRKDLAGTAKTIQHTVILLLQDPVVAAFCLEQLIFQSHHGLHIPVEINSPIDGTVALLHGRNDIITGFQIRQLEVSVFIKGNRLFPARALVAQGYALQGIATQLIDPDGTAQGLFTVCNRFRMGRHLHAILFATQSQCDRAILIEGYISDLLFSIHKDGSQRETVIGGDLHGGQHAGNDAVISGNCIMLTLLQCHRNCSDGTIFTKTEVLCNVIPTITA